MSVPPISGWPGIAPRGLAVCRIAHRVRITVHFAPMTGAGPRFGRCVDHAAPIGRSVGSPGWHTAGRIVQQADLNRLAHLEPPPAANRYVYPHPGDLLHLDIKKLGRFCRPGHRVTGNRRLDSPGAGWEYVHVAIDDHSRISFAGIYPDETTHSTCQALLAALRYFQTLGVTFTRVMTDNGTCYRSKRFARLCRRLKLRHIKTQPYTPRTNGKAERFIQITLREWAYARAYDSSDARAEHLPLWLHRYNWHRPHASLKYQPPMNPSISH